MDAADWTIFLDLDGVCADFVGGALRAHGLSHLARDPKVTWLPDSLGMDEDTFWAPINALGATFWRSLDAYAWFADLYARLRAVGTVVFLSKPSRGADSVSGKLWWLQDRLGVTFRDYIFTPRKRYLAGPRRVLIDDQDKNLSVWDGPKILFPQRWNSAKRDPDPAMIVADVLVEVHRIQALAATRDAEEE